MFSLPLMTRPVVPSSEIQSPALNTCPFTRISRGFFVDLDVARARHAALAHAAGHDRRVTGHAAARSQNARRHFHAVNIFRRGFRADENHRRFLARDRPFRRLRRR